MTTTRKLECVVCDLDGSLLNSEKQISPQDKQTIACLKAKGIPVFIVTGRPFEFARVAANMVGTDLPVCCCNGGHIYDFAEAKTLYTDAIDKKLALRIYHYLMEKGLPFIIYTPDRVLFRDREMKRYQVWNERNKKLAPADKADLGCIQDPGFDPEATTYIKFLLAYVTEQDRVDLEAFLGSDASGISCVFSEEGVLDVNAGGVNKGKGVKKLAELYHFDLANTLALGDNYNDRQMLEVCGVPVATSNAEQDILDIAAFVTAHHNESPLTHAVNTLYPGLLD